MRKAVLILGISAAVVGCKSQQGANPRPIEPSGPATQTTQSTAGTLAPTGDDPVIASVMGVDVHARELHEPLMRAFGFDMLMYVVQRDMARDAARKEGIVVSPQDIATEREWTLRQMFANVPEGQTPESLLDQFLAQPKPRDQMRTQAEFDLLIETNTYLRKLSEKSFKMSVSEEDLRAQFEARYGTNRQVRHIMLANMQEVQAAQRRLAAGEDFAQVARAMSRNPNTSRSGGELPPFTINDKRFPQNFRQVAFALKPGEVSDPVVADGSYHLLKLDRVIDAKAVKYEDVKESLREDVEADLIIQGIKAVRTRLAEQALAQMKVTDPILKAEFDARLKARDNIIRDREKIRHELEKRRNVTTQPDEGDPDSATRPATRPVTTLPAAGNTGDGTTPPPSTQRTSPDTEEPAVANPIAPTPPATQPAASSPDDAQPPKAAAEPPATRPAPTTPATQP